MWSLKEWEEFRRLREEICSYRGSYLLQRGSLRGSARTGTTDENTNICREIRGKAKQEAIGEE